MTAQERGHSGRGARGRIGRRSAVAQDGERGSEGANRAQERGHSGRRTKGRIGRKRSVVESVASSKAKRRPEYYRSRDSTI